MTVYHPFQPTPYPARPREGAANDALANLGFKPAEASAAVAELGEGATLDALLRHALRKAAK